MDNFWPNKNVRRRNELENYWIELAEGIRLVQNREPMTSKRFIELYTKVYNYCTSGKESQSHSHTRFSLANERTTNRLQSSGNLNANQSVFTGQELYEKLRDFLREDLTRLNETCLDKSGEILLGIYSMEWDKYTFTAKVINGIFSYLNRHFIRHESESGRATLFQIYQLALDIWKETVLEKIHQNLTVGALDLLEKERLGDTINGTLIHNVVGSFIDLGLTDIGEIPSVINSQEVPCKLQIDPKTGLRIALGTYQKYFECQYLQNIHEFYMKESHVFLHDDGNSLVDYMKKAEQRLIEEETRAEKFLHQTSWKKQKHECEETLIRSNLDMIYTEFTRLLIQELNDDTSRAYNLVNKLDNALPQMTKLFRDHVVGQGHQKFQALGVTIIEPKAFVHAILEVFNKFKNMVEICFHNDPLFKAALDKACGDFINKNCLTDEPKSSFKSAELLARYCDSFLRKSNKASEEQEVEDLQTDVMAVFKFLEDKDAFQKFYSKMFANRLVQQLSASDDAESSMIAKLKHACGYEYTSKLQRMYQDISLSRELQDEFKVYAANHLNNRFSSDFQVQILSTSSWPLTQCSSDFALPNELEANIQDFHTFYISKYNGRKLNWLFSRCRGDLICNCFQSKHIFQASAYQMAILLMFNSTDTLRFQEIQDATKLHTDVLNQVLKAIFKSKLCTCEDELELKSESVIKLCMGYKNKKVRVNINVALKNEAKKESEQIEVAVEEDRKILLQACIVRIMKMRKVVRHQTLLAEVIQQMTSRFKANVSFIKKCIDMLIEKEYMERVADQKDTYSYIA